MKFRKAMLVTFLLLAILTIGAVSASDNMNSTLTVDDTQEEPLNTPSEEIMENEDADDVLSSEANDSAVEAREPISADDSAVEAGEPISADDFNIHYDNNITNLDDFLIWMDNCPVNGEITLVINGTPYTEYMSAGDDMWITALDLELTKPGTYFLAVKFKPTGSDELTLIEFDFNNGMGPNDTALIGIYDKIDVSALNNMLAYVIDNDSLVGTVTLCIDDAVYYKKSFNGNDDILYISDMNLDHDIYMTLIGNHTVRVKYNNLTKESIVSFGFNPFIQKHDIVAANDTSYIIFKAPGSFKGNVNIYDTVYNSTAGKYEPNSLILADYQITDSASAVPLPNLTAGTHAFYANYTIDGKNYGELFSVDARENSQGFTSDISSTEVKKGTAIYLSLSVPVDGVIRFYLDKDDVGSTVSEANCTYQYTFSNLAVGKYVLAAIAYGDNGEFYYKAFLVNVKSSQATVMDNASDASTTSIYAQLILTDTATGEVFIKNVTVGPISSTYTNPNNTNVSNSIAETINQLLSIAITHAGDNAVTIKSQNVSDPDASRFDNRTYTLRDGSDGRFLVVNGNYGAIWSYNLTVTAEYAGSIVSINDAAVVLSAKSFTYNGKVQKPKVKTIAGKALVEGTDYVVVWSNPSSKNAGTYTIKITGKGSYNGTTSVKYTISKAANPLKVKAKTAKVKFSKLKKKAQTLKVTQVIKFTKKGQGTMTYAKVSGNKKITINKKNGKVTVKKGLKKGIYKVKVKIKAKGNSNYKASSYKKITFKIKVY